ncbi:MAG: monovalent cation/H(+) antiporter subunit G [Anaerolineaceae bacterium]|nr:monovalent cation/H(+) antiporter subunit G [Anaerolineaceae bacterium]
MQSLLPWLADGLVIVGAVIMGTAVYGMIWLPDVYTRLHAASKAVVLGVIPILLASTVSGEPAIIFRVILISMLLLLTAPVSAHAIGHAAYQKREKMKTADSVDESGRLTHEDKEQDTESNI